MISAITLFLTNEIFLFFGCYVPHSTSYGDNVSQLSRLTRVSSHVTDFNKIFCHRAIGIINFENLFHYELVSNIKASFKTLLQQGLWEPKCYRDLVYKLKKNESRADFFRSNQKKILYLVFLTCNSTP